LVTPYFNKKAMQELPIGIQSFSELRKYDFLYVDKTEDILYKKSNRTFRLIITQTDFSLSKTNPTQKHNFNVNFFVKRVELVTQ
jgi:hypothetical protein